MSEKSPLSSAVLLADISGKIEEVREAVGHVASSSSQTALHMAKAVRIFDSQHALSASDRMALERVTTKQERVAARLEKLVESLTMRPPTLTSIQDVPMKRDEDITTTFMIGQPWVGVDILGKRIPSKWVAKLFVIGFVVFGVLMLLVGMGLKRAGVTPQQVVRAAGGLVAP